MRLLVRSRVATNELSAEDSRFVTLLLSSIWHYETNRLPGLVSDVERLALRNHVTELLLQVKHPVFVPNHQVRWSAELESLSNLLQPLATENISSLLEALERQPPPWLPKASDAAIWQQHRQRLLEWFVRLWLFVDINITEPQMLLSTVISSSLPQKMTLLATDFRSLSDDFCAKSLTRKANFEFNFTSNLAEHLTFNDLDRGSLNIFRHSRMLEHVRTSDESRLFPEDFLVETRKTLRLLFPVSSKKSRKRVQKLQHREQVDVEALMGKFEMLALKSYPYYGQRLAEIQRRYDAAKPRKAKQWWYDRRNRLEWTALLVALVLFVLTVIFGLIQSVTGILQVIYH